MYFLNHQDIRWKGVLKRRAFFYLHMEMLCPNLLTETCQYTGTIECSINYVLLLPAYLVSIFLDLDVFKARNGHTI